MSDSQILIGLECGDDCWTIALLTEGGRKLVDFSQPAPIFDIDSNGFYDAIKVLIVRAKKEAHLPADYIFHSLGLCLSRNDEGRLRDNICRRLTNECREISRHFHVYNSEFAALAAANRQAGLVLTAGTSSRAVLLNPDGSTVRCGGWGHKITEVGSASWLSTMAVKTVIDDEDNLKPAPFNTTSVRQAILDHFGIKDRFGLLKHFYQDYNKTFHADLVEKIVQIARNGDPLGQWLLNETGKALGEYVAALYPSVNQELMEQPGGLEVICIGQVWNHFDMMEQGFLDGATSQPGPRQNSQPLKAFSLLRLEVNTAVGAIYLASKQLEGLRTDGEGVKRFYHWSR